MEQHELSDQRRVASKLVRERFGIEYTHIEPGAATAEWTLRDGDMNVHGVPYGGILFTLADSAAGMALGSMGGSVITISCSGSFLYGSREARRLICHAKVRKAGNTLGFIETEVYDDQEHLLATFQFVFGVRKDGPRKDACALY